MTSVRAPLTLPALTGRAAEATTVPGLGPVSASLASAGRARAALLCALTRPSVAFSRSLSGGELPLDDLYGPAAAQGAAAAPWAAVRLVRAMRADGMSGRGRVEAGARAAEAARRAAAARLARLGAAAVWQTVAAVAAAGLRVARGERPADFLVSHGRHTTGVSHVLSDRCVVAQSHQLVPEDSVSAG